jgi:hypothetical protein
MIQIKRVFLRQCKDKAAAIISESWAEKGEKHRALTFRMAHNALLKASKQDLQIECWRDAALADRMARKAAGLDQDTTSINL